MTPVGRGLASLACVFVVLAGCTESDAVLDAGSDGSTSATRPVEDAADVADDADEDDGGDTDQSAAIADAEQAVQDQGFSAAGARCMVESMVSGGIPVEDLEQLKSLVPGQAIIDAATQAGIDCAEEIAGDIPEGLVDLEDPVIRDQFVRAFSQNTGLTIEQADCVAQYFIDNGVNFDALMAAAGGTELDPETARQVNGAMESCV